MALLSRINGVWQNAILRFVLMDNSSSTGGVLTTLTNTSTGLKISAISDLEATGTPYSAAAATVQTIATPGTYVAPSTSMCRFGAVDATNHPGLYELQLLNSRLTPNNASFLVICVQAPGSNCSPQSFILDLSAQVDVRENAGQAITAAAGIQAVNLLQMQGQASLVNLLALELAGRTIGTVTSATFTPSPTQFECSDITLGDSTPVFANKGMLVTSSSGVLKRVGIVLTDIVGTSGRRFTTTALPAALANGDTVIIM